MHDAGHPTLIDRDKRCTIMSPEDRLTRGPRHDGTIVELVARARPEHGALFQYPDLFAVHVARLLDATVAFT